MKKLFTYLVVAATIVSTLGLAAVVPAASAAYAPKAGDKVKVAGNSAVYIVGQDGKRHLVSNEATYWTWYTGTWATQGVMTITQSEFDGISSGSNVVARAGSGLVKFDNSTKLYVAGMDGKLYEIDAATAAAWFPGQTPTMIQSSFESNYTKAAGVLTSTSKLPDGSLIKMGSDIYVIVDGKKRMVTPEGFTANGFQNSDVVTVGATPAYDSGSSVTGKEAIFAGVAGTGAIAGSDTTLKGNAGSITVEDDNEFSDEEIEEGDEDRGILTFTVEADDESDVEITSVKVEFYNNSGSPDSRDFDDYADEVSVWFNDKKVGSADVSDFSENDDTWSKSISLDGLVIDAGEEEEITVGISALDIIDSEDSDNDDWNADVTQVRFMDGDGVSTTEDTSGDVDQDFDFVSAGNDESIEIKSSSSDPDASTLLVDADDVSDFHKVFSFKLEAEENDIDIEDLDLYFDLDGTNYEDMISDVKIEIDGEEFNDFEADEGSSYPGIYFDIDNEFTVDADSNVVVDVFVEFLEGTDGEEITAETYYVAGTGADDVEDTNTIYGETHELSESVATISSVSWAKSQSDTAGTIDFFFTITADEEDVYFDSGDILDTLGGSGSFYSPSGDTTDSGYGVISIITGDSTNTSGDTYEVLEGDSAKFRIRYETDGVGSYEVTIEKVAGQTIDEDDQLSPTVIVD
jgi:hypothetical protein